MNLEERLIKIAFKMKNLILLDFSFPGNKFLEFKKIYDSRYIAIPGRRNFAMDYASGLTVFGKNIVIYGLDVFSANKMINDCDPTLNVKILLDDNGATWNDLEKKLTDFGTMLLLIPMED